MSRRFRTLCIVLLITSLPSLVSGAAAPAPFDLAGPILDVRVTRAGVTLPMLQVASLQAGDNLLIRVRMPDKQTTRYLMIAAFLRGSTNPPPTEWFKRCDTWKKDCQEKGLSLTVPADAQQLLLFFAPQTGGDFKTLMSAVRGRPGAFVRASQELNQAARDHLRLERFLSALRDLQQKDPSRVKEATPLLARSLAIKVNEKCLERAASLQAPCLMEGRDALILDDGREKSMLATLTSGPASDLAMQAGNTPMLSGSYSPYIGSVMDLARLMDSFRTANYQYIPALSVDQDDRLELMLNTPPSFHEPFSVLVAALPAVEVSEKPRLNAIEPNKSWCAQSPSLLLAVDGSPLLFASRYARDIRLQFTDKSGQLIALPAHADPVQGAYVVDMQPAAQADLPERLTAELKGYWGFDSYQGPAFSLINPARHQWSLAPGEEAGLIVGREDVIHLQSGPAVCLEQVALTDAQGKEISLAWTTDKQGQVAITLPLHDAVPGIMTLVLRSMGQPQPQEIPLRVFSDPGRLESFTIHAGEPLAILKGTRLDQVDRVFINNLEWAIAQSKTQKGIDELMVQAADTPTTILRPGEPVHVKVYLNDGRELLLDTTVANPRPGASLLAKSASRAAPAAGLLLNLGSEDLIPVDAKLSFSLRAVSPIRFGRDDEIEVATEAEDFSVRLSMTRGGLTLSSNQVAVLKLDPVTAFGSSAFGEIKYRRWVGGVAGEWQPLGTLVRLPVIKQVVCNNPPESDCELNGDDLYLLEAVAANEQFVDAIKVAEGFPGDRLQVPHPVDARLYLRLRDAPDTVNVLQVMHSNPVAQGT